MVRGREGDFWEFAVLTTTCILRQDAYHAEISYAQVSIRMPSDTSDTDYGPRKRESYRRVTNRFAGIRDTAKGKKGCEKVKLAIHK